jgi:Holliday junction DNA helicase RuvA
MIASIEGNVTQIIEDSLVISIGGLGIKVFVPPLLVKSVEPHKIISLHTYLIVREDALNLYGFETLEERDMYIMLLGANGVGPRTALAIVSTLSLDMISKAVVQELPEFFSRVPGVGKKTAQSIILQLQGKISKSQMTSIKTGIPDVDGDVIAALTNLGYSIVEAQTALQMIPKDGPEDLESRIRLALQYFT